MNQPQCCSITNRRISKSVIHRCNLCFVLSIVCCLFSATANASTLPASILYSDTSAGGGFSMRGLALSPDNSQIYVGFIQSSVVREISTSSGTVTTSSTVTSGQPKGVAVDSNSNVFATFNNSAGSKIQQFGVYNSALVLQTTKPDVTTSVNTSLGGITEANIGGTNYLYVTHNKGGGQIERYNVSTPSAPTLDLSFGTSGVLDLQTVLGNGNIGLNGITVASDGTIFVAGQNDGVNRGTTVYKILSNLTTITSAPVTQAMDVALYNGNVYAVEYNGGSSAIAVLSQSNLSLLDTITLSGPSIGSNAPGSDSGFSGIDISPTGVMYVADQVFNGNADQLLVATVPEPATWVLLISGGMGFVGQLYRKRQGH